MGVGGVGVAVLVSDTLWQVLDSCSWNSPGTVNPLACCGQALILNLEPWLSGLMTLENPYSTLFVKAVNVTLRIKLLCRVHHEKCLAG